MTTAYLHLTDTDKPESQTAITASFVDENGKHIDIGGGGTTEIHTDDTLSGNGTADNPLKLSDTTSQDIKKAKTLTSDNLVSKGPVEAPSATPVGVYKDSSGNLSVLCMKNSGIAKQELSSISHIYAITIPAIPALAAIRTLETSATLPDVVNKVNEILNAVKTSIGQ